MIRKIAVWTFVCFCLCFCGSVYAAEPEISAYAAVLYEPLTGTVLYAQNCDERLPMASTTKIMTALLAFESGRAAETVRITEEMVRTEGSSMGLTPGDALLLAELTEGMMMTSGNDSAKAIALFLSGSEEAFAERMNARAEAIGMENTSFVTASGLDADGHFSTAFDMALLAAEAMKCVSFAETVGQFSLMVDFVQPEKSLRCDNHNKLLHLYEDCTGIKTGFTKKSGRCLVSSAERNGMELICVTLNAPDDWNDHAALFDYGFSCFSERIVRPESYSVPVVGGTSGTVVCSVDAIPRLLLPDSCEVKVCVRFPRFVYAPVFCGDRIGSVCYIVNGKVIAETALSAAKDIEYAENKNRSCIQWVKRLLCRE